MNLVDEWSRVLAAYACGRYVEESLQAEDLDRVRRHWDSTLPDLDHLFYGFPPLRNYLYESVTGETHNGPLPRDWLERWTVENVLGPKIPVDRCLSLCCGFGEVERILARLGAFEHCLGVDLAAEALDAARRKAAQEGLEDRLTYEQRNIDEIRLQQGGYDLVWANGALHHLNALEHVISQVYISLRPGGVFVVNEYVGPKRQQLSPRRKEIVNSVIHLIPPRLRERSEDNFVPPAFRRPRWRRFLFQLTGKRVSINSASSARARRAATINEAYRRWLARIDRRRFRYGKVWDSDPYEFTVIDPSEGVRSDEIIPAIAAVFDDVDIRYYNGSVLLYALDPTFYRNFDPSNPQDRRLLETLIEIERGLIDSGELQSDHAHIIATKSG